MNEKQRYLLKDLEAWQKSAYEPIGGNGYGSRLPWERKPKRIVAAIARKHHLESVIAKYEREAAARFQREKRKIDAQVEAVRRSIIFDKPDLAVRVLRALLNGKPKRKSAPTQAPRP